MDSGSIEKLFLRKSTNRYTWTNYGCSYNSFNFQVFTVSNYVNYAALLLPFDIFTWILTFAGGIFVNILVFKMTTSSSSTNGYLFVWSFITALEQPVAAKKESSTIKLLILCRTWLTSIYILGSLYKGDMVSVHFLRKSNTRYIWGNYGCSYNAFNFKVFTVTNYINYAALLLPFDIFTWVLLFIGGVFVNILVFRITASTKPFLLLWSFTTAMEQPIATKRGTSTLKLLILCSTWLTSIYILGSLYKGDMVSVLTSRTTQQVPNTLKELISTNTTIFTTNHYDDYLVGPTPIARCNLHDLVIPQLMNAINSKYTLHHVLTSLRLGSKCIRIFNAYEMSKNISNYGFLSDVISGKQIIIPDQFAIVDPTFALSMIQATMVLFPTYVPIHNGEIALYTELKPWIVAGNFFAPRFISGLARVVESGIYEWWSNNFQEVTLIVDIQAVKGEGNIAEEFAKVSFGREMRTKHGMTAVPISFDKLRIPIVVCLFCVGIGVVFLCQEWIYFHFRRRTRSKVNLKGVAFKVTIVRSMGSVPMNAFL
ncbi:hypothetical protein Fcan01_25430 [Folsomia candida]|uniref:Uncharacterized protein n=1 Tax=Folsomia candida TaxID=158441 RepID=A0A226D3R2_FOLCA|nr:hypothetical protein Fcan01_25430 [Folsomia candida]